LGDGAKNTQQGLQGVGIGISYIDKKLERQTYTYIQILPGDPGPWLPLRGSGQLLLGAKNTQQGVRICLRDELFIISFERQIRTDTAPGPGLR
jgi:hypothetical protein